ncbi:thermonuclease family protein [Parvibaculum sp.]|uniref:thermonuclease family protein n=1 Tax=Parvibaculum sp. TaxID=2024848 RepID=UPI001B1A1D88|nr:thermonuclease family protein [Parvibaculum sp.]MBO6669035.1 thermonuclease family protein [Parvibaculum sp.]MBO6691816.1 thermonuclease family protein [Parvibaculum sp.]MBO6715829.1 thermonuclease family protein [Parvibaculum sp.]
MILQDAPSPLVLILTFLVLSSFQFAEGARAAECRLEDDEQSSRVIEIVDGDTLLLEDGREVRLTGIQAPKLPLGRPNFQAWPLAVEARKALSDLALDKTVMLRFGGTRSDRHGRVLAQVFVKDADAENLWLQREMLRSGLARVYTFNDNRACSDELLSAEREARGAGRGIWVDPFYDIRDASNPNGLMERIGSFELVEGEIVSATQVRGRLYINFGEDYRNDFTVTVRERDVKLLAAEEPWTSLLDDSTGRKDLAALSGKLVRVRGWLDRYNGPEIEISHPEQIEFSREDH